MGTGPCAAARSMSTRPTCHDDADAPRKPLHPEPPFVRPAGGGRNRGTPFVPTRSSGRGAQERSRDETACGARFSARPFDGFEHRGTHFHSPQHSNEVRNFQPALLGRFQPALTGVIASQAVLVAIAVDADGRRQVLGVELANRESGTSWRDLLLSLRQRGLHGVEFVVSDDHPGLRQAIREVLSETAWQRCYVHSCAMRWIICHAGPTTTACRSCVGFTTGANWPRCAAIWPRG